MVSISTLEEAHVCACDNDAGDNDRTVVQTFFCISDYICFGSIVTLWLYYSVVAIWA